MPRYGSRYFSPYRRVSPFWIIDLLIDVGIIAILIALFFIAMPFIILLLILFGGKYALRYFPRRYYGRWR